MLKCFSITLMLLVPQTFRKTLQLFQPLLYIWSQGTEQVEKIELLLKPLSQCIFPSHRTFHQWQVEGELATGCNTKIMSRTK